MKRVSFTRSEEATHHNGLYLCRQLRRPWSQMWPECSGSNSLMIFVDAIMITGVTPRLSSRFMLKVKLIRYCVIGPGNIDRAHLMGMKLVIISPI
jgi:hypothetical protein